MFFKKLFFTTLALSAAAMFYSCSAYATTYTVNVTDSSLLGNTTADPVPDGSCDAGSDTEHDCTLREAIIAANSNLEDDDIILPSGVITLEQPGSDEDEAATGDLDVTQGNVSIVGTGESSTTINGNDLDRILDIFSSDVNLSLSDLTLTHGSAYNGGGIYSRGTLTLTHVALSNMTAGNIGGALYLDSSTPSTVIDQSTISSNSAGTGGGIYTQGPVTITQSSIEDNSASTGGGVFVDGAVVSIDETTIQSNSATGSGANSAGGGIRVSLNSELRLSSSLVTENVSDGNGAGIFTFCSNHTNTIVNSFIVHNTSASQGGGVVSQCSNGLYTYINTVEIIMSTIADNEADTGGGVYADQNGDDPTTIIFRGSIIANNSSISGGNNCRLDTFTFATLISEGYNIESENDCGFTATGDLVDTDPLFDEGGLSDNGGNILTIAVQPLSAARDHVPADACLDESDIALIRDARGEPRPVSTGCDAGAYELSADEVRTALVTAEDLADDSVFSAQVESFEGSVNGTITVTYTDHSTAVYTAFPSYSGSKKTKVKQYGSTGYLIVLHPKGKKIALMNAYTGEVIERVRLSTNKYKKNSFKILDVRHDGQDDIVVTSKKDDAVLVSLLKINTSTANLALKDQETLTGASSVKTKNTTAPKKKIRLKDSDGNVLYTFKVGKKFKMTLN